MAEYIEREAAIGSLMEILDRPKHAEFLYTDEICGALQSIPAADVRPVVLCRDCKWTKTDEVEDPAIYCKKWDRWEMPPDGFCWLGKKKEKS